jgi:predicted PurR-regulated permease PerM
MGFEMTRRERRWFEAILVLGAVALGFVVLGFVGQVFAEFGDLIMIFFLAWLLAFMLSPLINRVTSIPFMTRTGAIFLVYFALLGTLVVVSVVVAAAVVDSIGDFIANLPSLRASLPDILGPWQERLDGLGVVQLDLVTQATAIIDNLSQYAIQLAAPLQQIAVASVGAIATLLLVVIFSLYIVADRDRLVAFGFWLVPPAYKAEAKVLEEAVSRSFGGFIRGQVATGLAFGAIVFVGSVVFGLDYIPVITVVAGAIMIIPFFGPFVSWVPPILVAAFTKPDALLGVTIVTAIGWVLVMNWLQPRIMSTSLRIHPIVVLGSALVGIKVAGISGAVFGIPIAAVASALVLHALNGRLDQGPVAARAAARAGMRQGRVIRPPREPNPATDEDVEATPTD